MLRSCCCLKNASPNPKTQFTIALICDFLLIGIIMSAWSWMYFTSNNTSSLWKVLVTFESLLLLFEFRLRVPICYGYPVSTIHGRYPRFSGLFSLSRIKKVDQAIFIIVLILAILKSTLLAATSFERQLEKRIFIAMTAVNSAYLILWIIFTNE